jgi:F-type H+-transporting ATPase subunit epsilon
VATPFALEVVTPDRTLFSGEVEEVTMRAEGGDITFLAHHAPYIAALDITVLRARVAEATTGAGPSSGTGGEGGGSGGGGALVAAVHGGFVHVDANRVLVLASVAELAGEIDAQRAARALEAAKERLSAEGAAPETPAGAASRLLAFSRDPDAPAAALRRAEVRLQAAALA